MFWWNVNRFFQMQHIAIMLFHEIISVTEVKKKNKHFKVSGSVWWRNRQWTVWVDSYGWAESNVLTHWKDSDLQSLEFEDADSECCLLVFTIWAPYLLIFFIMDSILVNYYSSGRFVRSSWWCHIRPIGSSASTSHAAQTYPLSTTISAPSYFFFILSSLYHCCN